MRTRRKQAPKWSKDLEKVLTGAMTFNALRARHPRYVDAFVRKYGGKRPVWFGDDDLAQEGWLIVRNALLKYKPGPGSATLVGYVNMQLRLNGIKKPAAAARTSYKQELAFIEHEIVEEAVVDFPGQRPWDSDGEAGSRFAAGTPIAEWSYDARQRVAFLERVWGRSSNPATQSKLRAVRMLIQGESAESVMAQVYGGTSQQHRKQLLRAIADARRVVESQLPKFECLISTRNQPRNANGQETSYHLRLRPLRKAGKFDAHQGHYQQDTAG